MVAERSSNPQVTERLFYRFWETPRKGTSLESYFSTVIGPAILLKQDSTKGVFLKNFHNFQNKYDYVPPLDGCS